jgi:hypothetical protein
MHWSDVLKPPRPRTLRQFAGLWLVVFAIWAAWRLGHGERDWRVLLLALAAFGVGVPGLVRPALVRWIYTGWMIAAFPIGWTVSQIMLLVLFYGVFTPVGLVFRAIGRDGLRLRRRSEPTYWLEKPAAQRVDEYFRQS